VTKLDYIGITTADMGKALDFYRLLGLEFPDGAESEVHAEATLEGGFRLGFDTVETTRDIEPDWTPPSGSPRVALAFRCTSPAEVDATYADLLSAGHRGQHEPWDAIWGHRYATVLDPDGNRVDLYADL
jgi:catechol 2,3-dioxygenase-like lactoylglutathione lyase family enzyme